MIPESFIKDLLDRVDIVDVVSPYVSLKKKGINWFGLCPFHHEKTGSFSVNQNKQFFKCFGCGAHGNAVGFLMQYKGITYPEAIRELAQSVGLPVPEERGERKRRERSESLSDLMLKAQNFYIAELAKSQIGLSYLKERQISEATRQKFGLGYSPDNWQALEAVFGEKYSSKALEDCGLVITKDGHRYDRFRGRVMFPIRNPRGQVIGFGARVIGKGEPKYLNSPETDIFKKGQEVYGLWEGREAIRKAGRAIVCEGYMDVIQLSQAGFGEAVAALGTAIGEAHIRKLFKIVPQIIFSFDGDDAGRHAARRALEQALPVITDTQEARFILLPPEHDPDSLIKAEGSEAYEREIQHSFPLSTFFIDSLKAGKSMGTPEGRSQFLAEAKPLLLSMKEAPVLRQQLIGSIGLVVRMEPAEICSLIGIPFAAAAKSAPAERRRNFFPVRGRGVGNNGRPMAGGALPVLDLRDRMLRSFFAWPSLFKEFQADIEEHMTGSHLAGDQKILEAWRAAMGGEDQEEGGSVDSLTTGTLVQLLAGSQYSDEYSKIASEEMSVGTPKYVARREIRTAFLKIALDEVRFRLDEVASAEVFDAELYNGLQTRLKQLGTALKQAASEDVPMPGQG